MSSLASILGLVLPSVMCVGFTLALKRDLHATASGAVAANLIAGGFLTLLLVLVAACVLNVVCLVAAVRRREPFWKWSALGIPLCGVLAAVTALAT